MELFRRLLGRFDAAARHNLLLAASVGVALLVAGGLLYKPPARETGGGITPTAEAEREESRERQLERRLAAVLSQVDGAGRVSVMVTLDAAESRAIAQSGTLKRSQTEERDAEGGSRLVANEESQTSYVLVKQKDGGEAPLELASPAPKVAGVLVAAQGAGDATVKDALTRAAYTALGAPPHKVLVVKMND